MAKENKHGRQATQEDMIQDTFSDEEVVEDATDTSEEEEEEIVDTSDTSDGEEEDDGEEEEEQASAEDDIADFFSDEDDDEEDSDEEEEEPIDDADEEEEESVDNEEDIFNITADDLEDLTTDPEKFSALLKKVYEKGQKSTLEEAKQEIANAKEEILRNIPDLVSKSANRVQNVKQTATEFFGKYPELKKKTQYVKDMTSVIQSKNPSWTPAQVLDEVGKRAERDLGISAKAEQREKERDNPKFAGAGGRRAPDGGADNRSKQEKLLDDTFG